VSKLVSVMVPSRNRVPLLQRSLETIAKLAQDTTRVQVIVRTDDDDTGTHDWLRAHPDLVNTVCVGPRGRGYADLHNMYTDMCQNAQGRFLFLWNDDAEMMTTHWDEEIAKHDNGKPCYLLSGLQDTRGRDSYLFPIVHRSWFEATGRFSASPHNDTYIFHAFKPYPQLFLATGITIKHHALQLLHDQTSREAQQWWPVTKKGWDSPEVQNALAMDTAKLGQLVKQHGL